MKKTVSVFLALFLLLSLTGCAAQTAPASAPAPSTVTIVDHLERTVTLPADIRRVAVVGVWPLPSVLCVFFNSAQKLVGVPEASLTAAQNGLLGELYPEMLGAATDFITGDDVNMEELLKLAPDVVFFNAANPAMGDKLERGGFNAVAVSVNKWNYDCIETLNQWVGLFSEIFPENDRSEAVERYSNDVCARIRARVDGMPEAERARVLFLYRYTDTTVVTSGKSFFGQWWCDAVGAENVAEALLTDNAVEVNMEQVYAWDPDTVILTNFTPAMPEDLYGNRVGNYDWSAVRAVQNGRVFKMPLGMYRGFTPGADTPVTLLWLAKSVYPELFADVDVTAEARAYYKEVFGVALSDAQIASIFAPTAAAAGGAGA